ncbi:MAG: serine hydrolase domain-containing protein [Gemmatimonadales bacterium]
MTSRRHFVTASAAALGGLALPRSARGAPVFAPAARRFDPARLQAILDEAARSLGVVGAQLALYDGRELHEVATGLANLERRLPTTTDTLFQIGSTTKVFNAALVMTLVDEGALDLDQPVARYIDDFALADADATRRVTLRHLLSMSSGIDNGPYRDHGRGDDALDRYVASLASIPQVFDPGTAFGYSNAGSCIAGLAAARVAGRNWETLLAERILRPLGLEHSANFPEDLLFHPVALGYRYRGDASEPTRVPVWSLPRSMAPAGAELCCSAGDLVRFARMFLDEGVARDARRVLSAASVRTMQTPEIELPARLTAARWCVGPYWKTWGGQVLHGHSGTNVSGSSMLLWCPAKRVAIATIANVPNQGYPLANRIFDTVFPEIFEIEKPKLPTPATVTPAKVALERYLGRFEAFGSTLVFAAEGGKLIARVYGARGPEGGAPSMTSELIPLGDDRFLPRDPAMGGNRGWDVAFWGEDGAHRATHFLNGVFAMRRV